MLGSSRRGRFPPLRRDPRTSAVDDHRFGYLEPYVAVDPTCNRRGPAVLSTHTPPSAISSAVAVRCCWLPPPLSASSLPGLRRCSRMARGSGDSGVPASPTAGDIVIGIAASSFWGRGHCIPNPRPARRAGRLPRQSRLRSLAPRQSSMHAAARPPAGGCWSRRPGQPPLPSPIANRGKRLPSRVVFPASPCRSAGSTSRARRARDYYATGAGRGWRRHDRDRDRCTRSCRNGS